MLFSLYFFMNLNRQTTQSTKMIRDIPMPRLVMSIELSLNKDCKIQEITIFWFGKKLEFN